MKKNKLIILGVIFLLFSFFLLKDDFARAGDESDAIAVRIVPNPNHYSISRWYEKQGFTGSPQSLIVDGYSAIRDGRTVYVNAANLSGDQIYTNVYLISYNQDSSDKTVDILGQIIKKWRFNTDLENNDVSYTCSISSSACASDKDCVSDSVCATSGVASSSCQLKTAKNCLLDSDCPQNLFCDSKKAKIIRDLDRISTATELNSALESYKVLNSTYPKLGAGTYLSQHTVSVWPSWSDTFLAELNLSSLTDPINRLGACPGFDAKTCWNKDTNRFVFDPGTSALSLPAGSYGFIYRTDDQGSNYNICSVMETKGLGYTFEPEYLASSNCVVAIGASSSGTLTNTAPQIVDKYLVGEADQEFNGSIKVVDGEGNPTTWKLDTSNQSWPGWSAAPILQNTNSANLKKIYALRAGWPGTYNLDLTLSDGKATTTTSTPIVISNSAPFIEAEDVEFIPGTNNTNINYSFYITDNNFAVNFNNAYWYQANNESDIHSGQACAIKLKANKNSGAVEDCGVGSYAGASDYTKFFAGTIVYHTNANKTPYCSTTGCPTITNGNKCRWSDGTNPAWSYQCYVKTTDKAPYSVARYNGSNNFVLVTPSLVGFSVVGENRYKIDYQIPVPTSMSLTADVENIFRITAWDKYSATSTKDFKIKIKTEIPSLTFNCQASERLGYSYSCLLGATNQNGHTITYSSVKSLPSNLTISIASSSAYLSGKAMVKFGKAINAADEIIIKATNEYGASSTKVLPLQINSFCGDEIKQNPNTEGRGGIYNDGYEDCDYNDGVTNIIASSSPGLQYSCSTNASSTSPYPILTNNYCVFKSPVAGGGYCGDGYCQVKVETPNGIIAENDVNCPADCVSACVPQCNGKTCGDDNCGGSCEPDNCSSGTICTNGSCCPTSANMQISVDNYHTTYFNEKQIVTTEGAGCGATCGSVNTIYQGCCWAAIQKFNVTVQPGINVIAIRGKDVGAPYGLAATLNQAPCSSMTTSEISNWKCTKTAQSGVDWTKINFNDSTWEAAVSTNSTNGNALAPNVKQIWAKNTLGDSTIYCRYAFVSLVNGDLSTYVIKPACNPTSNCSGKNCGPDGCASGGTCGSNNGGCPSSNDICSDGKCVCVPDCDKNNKDCGSDGCGGFCGSDPLGKCPTDKMCNDAGKCVCKPNCVGKTCGSNGCGGSCGSCTTGNTCDIDTGNCVCAKNCSGKTCGSDGCGGSCGVNSGLCLDGWNCTNYKCVKCTGKNCLSKFLK